MSEPNNKEATTKKEPSSTMIYVSNLPFTTTDEQLRELFKDYEIKTAYVAKRRNGRSKGFGFVNLAKEGEQVKAIEKVDGKEFENRKLTAKIAFNDDRRNEKGELKEQFKKQLPTKQEGPPSETVVYVSNLPWSFNDEELQKFFTDLSVKSASVAKRRNGRSKGFGFVEFTTKEDQVKGLSFDQKKIEDRTITVKPSVNYRGPENQNKFDVKSTTGGSRSSGRSSGRSGGRGGGRGRGFSGRGRGSNRTGSRGPRNNNSSPNPKHEGGARQAPVVTRASSQPRTENTLYVSNLPFDLDDNDLKQIFSEFNVKNANVAQRQGGRSLGFGFVEFSNAQDQKSALEALDQSEVNNRVITVKVATGRRTGGSGGAGRGRGGGRGNGGRRSSNNNSAPRRRNPSNNNNNANEKREPSSTMIYVSNLPFTIDDKRLGDIFTGYKVKNAYVAIRRNGRSKGFGFVDFQNAEDQQKALKLNNQEVEGRPLTIQVANKVEPKQQSPPTTNK
jgi:RNA recognition motif-containing protein